MNTIKILEIFYFVSTLVGLIVSFPHLLRLVKRVCPLLVSLFKEFLSLMHEMILALGQHPAFIALINLLPWMLKACFYALGVLLAIIGSYEGLTAPQCLLCFAIMAVIGQIEFYLFRKLTL